MLTSPPFPGPLGLEIQQKVTQETWDAWRELQTKIINEYRLDLSEQNDRQTLLTQMRKFLSLDGEKADLLKVGTPTE